MTTKTEKLKNLAMVILASYLCFQTAAQSPKSPTVAILATHAGETHRVTNMVAVYEPDEYSGSKPTFEYIDFHFEIKGTQRGAEWTNRIVIPFRNIKRITFALLPNTTIIDNKPIDWKTKGPELFVEKRDGSSISLIRKISSMKESYTYEEIDTNGNVGKSFQFDDFYYYAPSVRDSRYKDQIPIFMSLTLWGFKGKITTPLGVEGTFSIRRQDVRSIEFQ